MRELERRRLRPTPEERAEDLARFAAIHERWLAKQPLDHPWMTGAVAPPTASCPDAVHVDAGTSAQLTLDVAVRVEAERGAA